MDLYAVEKLMNEARSLARNYRQATGKSLPGISSELAQHDAVVNLGLEPVTDTELGYDALGTEKRAGQRIQIKGRVIFDEAKKGQRIGQLKVDKEWDSVMLVIMDDAYESVEIWEAQRDEVLEAVTQARGSRRSNRGALSVAKFKNISQLVWTREDGPIDDELWDNLSNA